MTNLHGSDSESSDSEDSDENMEGEFEQFTGEGGEKGLHNLLFMKRAAKKQHEEFIESMNPEQEEDEEEEEFTGRRKFGPTTLDVKTNNAIAAKQKAEEQAYGKKSKSKSPLTNFKVHGNGKKVVVEQGVHADENEEDIVDAKNPWMNLKGGTKVTKKAKQLEEVQARTTGVISTELDVDDVISISDSKLEGISLYNEIHKKL